jgi:hypothetical protein
MASNCQAHDVASLNTANMITDGFQGSLQLLK